MAQDNVVDKTVEFVKAKLKQKLSNPNANPLLLGMVGPQGSGKTTTATKLKQHIQLLYPSLNIVQFSMDDLYLTFEEQQTLNKRFPHNVLLQGRGLPGTHDINLLHNILNDLLHGRDGAYPIYIPSYDKSAHGGLGDRCSKEDWTIVTQPVDLIIFEGWFNGYFSIPDEQMLKKKWTDIQRRESNRLDLINFESVLQINSFLEEYQKIWKLFDVFVCIKTSDINNVYKWRLQQEHDLIRKKGSGMSDEKVIKFLDRYMPVYYLYYDRLELMQNMVESLELDIDDSRTLVRSKM